MYSKNEVGTVFQEDFSCDNFHKKQKIQGYLKMHGLLEIKMDSYLGKEMIEGRF